MAHFRGKEEESLRQELGKQEREARKGEARGSPSLGRLCPESGNLSLAYSGRLVLCFITGSHSPVPTVQNRPMEYSQVVRHRFLVPACKGSNPFTPDYEHPIGSVKNELTTTGEAADCSP